MLRPHLPIPGVFDASMPRGSHRHDARGSLTPSLPVCPQKLPGPDPRGSADYPSIPGREQLAFLLVFTLFASSRKPLVPKGLAFATSGSNLELRKYPLDFQWRNMA